MKQQYKLLLFACLAITVADALGSVASRLFNFNYSMIWPVSIIIYCTLSFVVTKVKDLKAAILVTAFLGFFDSTIGWNISIFLNANTGKINNHPTPMIWLITILFVTTYGALLGLLAGGISKLISKTHQKKLPVN